MSFACSSSSAAAVIRSTGRTSRRAFSSLSRSRAVVGASIEASRKYSVETTTSPASSSTQTPPPPSTSYTTSSPSFGTSNSSATTPEAAQAYLTNLLSLPSDRQFPPRLALQVVTHKSYRYVTLPTNPHLPPSPESSSDAANANWAASHNARLSFLGRRAIASYLAMFVHSAIATNGLGLHEVDFLRGSTLEEKLEKMRHVRNVGRAVGSKWEVEKVMRWDENSNAAESGALTIRGLTVEAIMGAIFTQFGSPAAHTAFHLHVLPHLANQLRDPAFIERAQVMKKQLDRDMGGRILL